MSIDWNDELLTGMEEIDSQHRELFTRFHVFSTACDEGKGREELMPLLGFLDEYIRDHFRFEEKLMEDSGYPGLDVQQAQHLKFMEDLANLAEKMKQGELDKAEVIGLKGKMVRYMIVHVKNLDRQIAEFLRARETEVAAG